MENIEQKRIIWIEEDINKEEYQYTYYEFIFNLPDYQIIRVESVKEAFDIITDSNNYEQYKFKLFYVIVSGKLSEEFFNEYMKKITEYHILAATIIYCKEEFQKKNERKPFYLDTFLNPGGVASISLNVINYIKSVQCPYYLETPKIEKDEIIEHINKDPTFSAEFTYIESLAEMSYPLLISKHINSTLIEKEDFEKMQKEFMGLYPKLKHLFKPSQEKNIHIPYHILAKYYLHIYTLESNFFSNMNKELKERKFDKYRIYIYLLYHALNKGVFKSYSKSNLYRGGTLSIEEYNSLLEKFNKQKSSNLKNEKVFFFSRKFLSFSKKEYVANEFLQIAIICNYTGVYVRFIVEGIEDNRYYVSNIDINEMKLSKFSEEEEVLFLPLSCFEVVDIQEEKFCEKDIKIIKLRYLNKYKEEIDKNCEELSKKQNKDDINNFIVNAIHSKYAEELCRYLDIDDKLHKRFLDEFSKKSNIDLKFEAGARFQYKNSNPMGKKYSALKIFNGQNVELVSEMLDKHIEWLCTQLSSVQYGLYNGKYCLGGYDFDGNLVFCDDFNCCNQTCKMDRLGLPKMEVDPEKFIPKSEKIKVDNMNCGDIRKCVFKNKSRCRCLNEEGINQEELTNDITLKDMKKQYKQSGAIEAAMLGNAVGHFLANIEQFKNADTKGKLKIIGNSSIPLGFLLLKKCINIVPVIKQCGLNETFKQGFFVLSLFDVCRSFCSVINSESLNIKEKTVICGKKALGLCADVLFGYLGTEIGMKIALGLCITCAPGQIIVAGLTSLAFGFIGAKINNYFNQDENKKLIFYSDSFYYQYIPKKYREYTIPTLKWENPSIKAKSFAIELIVNEDGKNPSWLVINIPGDKREFNEDSNDGELIINYKGVPENAFYACFILYEFDVKNIDIKEFLAMKNGEKGGKKLSKRLIEYKILIVS